MIDPMVPVLCQILDVRQENEQTFTWVLSLPEHAASFSFLPGQFNMLYQFGMGEVPISISGASHRDDRIVHTIRAVGTVTRAMQGLSAGANIGVRGPFGTSWPVEEAKGKDLLLIAGGIGLAPLRPVLYQALHERDAFGSITVLYGARQPSELLFSQEVAEWEAREDVDFQVTVDMGDAGWHGHVGLVTELIRFASFDPANTLAMVCGPEIMMRFAAEAIARTGVPEERIVLSMERNMKCALGWCGHCQLGPHFVCKDGPVYPYPTMRRWLTRREA
jgi:NAD(P)H-flavin reductase